MHLVQAEHNLLIVAFKVYIVCYYFENGEWEPAAIPNPGQGETKIG